MAFADTGWIELRRLNLLLGRNSSGKTAVIRALRLMQQSLREDAGSQPLVFVSEGGVDVGSFDAILHNAPPTLAEVDSAVSEGDAEISDELRHWSKTISFSFRGSITVDMEQVKEWSLISSLALDTESSQGSISLGFEVHLGYSFDYYTKKVFLRKFELFYRETGGVIKSETPA